jgi:hypothetical protein
MERERKEERLTTIDEKAILQTRVCLLMCVTITGYLNPQQKI